MVRHLRRAITVESREDTWRKVLEYALEWSSIRVVLKNVDEGAPEKGKTGREQAGWETVRVRAEGMALAEILREARREAGE